MVHKWYLCTTLATGNNRFLLPILTLYTYIPQLYILSLVKANDENPYILHSLAANTMEIQDQNLSRFITSNQEPTIPPNIQRSCIFPTQLKNPLPSNSIFNPQWTPGLPTGTTNKIQVWSPYGWIKLDRRRAWSSKVPPLLSWWILGVDPNSWTICAEGVQIQSSLQIWLDLTCKLPCPHRPCSNNPIK